MALRTILWLGVVLAFAGMMALTRASVAGAVDPDEFEIVVTSQAMDYPLSVPERSEVRTVADFVSPLTVKVGDVECLVVDLTNQSARNAAGELVMRVGAPGQPAGCASEGTRIILIDRNGAELYEEFVFRGGRSGRLTQLGPKPPNERTGTSDFKVVILARTLDTPVSLPERPTVRTLGEAVGSLRVRVGSQDCVTVDLADRAARNSGGDLVIRVGAPGQRAGCANEGARVTFIQADGKELDQEFVFGMGTSQVLSNLAPKPPGSGESASSNTPSTLPSSGGAGETDSDTSDWPAVAAGLAAVAAILLFGLLAVRRTLRRSRGRA